MSSLLHRCILKLTFTFYSVCGIAVKEPIVVNQKENCVKRGIIIIATVPGLFQQNILFLIIWVEIHTYYWTRFCHFWFTVPPDSETKETSFLSRHSGIPLFLVTDLFSWCLGIICQHVMHVRSTSKWSFFHYVDKILTFLTTYPPALCWHFLWYECWQKVDIFGPPSYLVL